MRKQHSGFTLIELMIVVAIIGILAAVAIPQYTDYTQRSKISGAITGIGAYKITVALCLQQTGVLAGCNANTNGIPASPAAAGDINYVGSATVTDGVITLATTAQQSDATVIGIVLTPNLGTSAVVDWVLTGNGCDGGAGAELGRSIDCSGL